MITVAIRMGGRNGREIREEVGLDRLDASQVKNLLSDSFFADTFVVVLGGHGVHPVPEHGDGLIVLVESLKDIFVVADRVPLFDIEDIWGGSIDADLHHPPIMSLS